MLVVSVLRQIVGVIVLDYKIDAALVVVNAPAAVSVAADVADLVARNNRAFVRAERIDAPHVAKQTVPYFENSVVCNFIVYGFGRGVPPSPAEGNACIVSVENGVVVGGYVCAIEYDYADARLGVSSVGIDYIVAQDDVSRFAFRGGIFPRGVSDPNASRAVVEKFVACDCGVRHSERQFKAVRIAMRNFVAGKIDIFHIFKKDETAERERRLRGGVPMSVGKMSAVRKGYSANRQIFHRPRRRISDNLENSRKRRIVRLDIFRRFALARNVIKNFFVAVEIELALPVEGGKNVDYAKARIFVVPENPVRIFAMHRRGESIGVFFRPRDF